MKMTKKERKAIASIMVNISNELALLSDIVGFETTDKVVNTNLENRNYDVFICREYLHMSYAQIANALNISIAQVGESLKVLRDKGLIESSRKDNPTLIEDFMDEVGKLHKKKYSRNKISKELGISPQTVTRCLERLENC